MSKKILLIMLSVLLAVSIFFNGWLLYGKSSVNQVPKNLEDCACDKQCTDPSCIQQCTSICMITILNNEMKNQASRLQQNIDDIKDLQSQVNDALNAQKSLDPSTSDYQKYQRQIDELNTKIQQLSSTNQQMQIQLQQNINVISEHYDQWSNLLAKDFKAQQEIIKNLR